MPKLVVKGFRENVIPPSTETVIFVVSAAEIDAAVKSGVPGVLAMPYTLNITSLRMDVDIAPTGANLIVDMNWDGVTSMTTKFTIEASELSTLTATTQPSLITNVLPVGTKVSFDIDQVGATLKGKFIQVTLTGYKS
jgi:hypothetical protein